MDNNLPAPKHPVAFFFHGAFKAAAIIYFIAIYFVLTDAFTINFVVLVLILAMDFWTVKNMTGRLLVGLRWWNDASGTDSAWRFESLPEGTRQIDSSEKQWFWALLVTQPVVWLIFAIVELFRVHFDYLLLCILAIIMGYSNLWGYFKCSKEAKSQVQAMSQQVMSSALQQGFAAAVARV